MLLKTIAACILLFSFVCTSAQVKKKIKKSRRSKTESQFALTKNDILFEWEAGHETFDALLSTTTLPNFVLHYGISNRLEVNIEISIVNVADRSVGVVKKTTGIEPVLAGLNYLLRKENKKGPAVTASLQLAIPFLASANFTASHLAPVLQLGIQQSLNKKITADFTPGIFWDGFATAPSYSYTTALTYKSEKKITLSAEVFGFLGHDAPQHYIDAEVDYSITKQWVIGITGGVGISSAAHKNYVGINGSYGFNTGHKKHSLPPVSLQSSPLPGLFAVGMQRRTM
jgi:Putative MetA-pathway of phenol degradation